MRLKQNLRYSFFRQLIDFINFNNGLLQDRQSLEDKHVNVFSMIGLIFT